MRIAYYYHIPIYIDHEGDLFFPAYVGRYIDALSVKVEKLVLIVHSLRGSGEYKLESSNIELIDLGIIQSAWYRHFFNRKILAAVLQGLNVEILIIRCPTPLALFFHKFISKNIVIMYYLVGSYYSGAQQIVLAKPRDILVKMYLYHYTFKFNRIARGARIIANSPELAKEFTTTRFKVDVIPSSILVSEDFYKRADTCQVNNIKLLYVGRIDPQKGLRELVSVISELRKLSLACELHLIGDTNSGTEVFFKELNKMVESLGLEECVYFHGAVKSGAQLNEHYRNADIFVLPSFHEGFPRVIFEAMANSLPVISTSVGSIPIICEHENNILLVPKKSIDSIVNAVQKLLYSKELRVKLIKNGFELAKQYTLETSVDKMIFQLETMRTKIQVKSN